MAKLPKYFCFAVKQVNKGTGIELVSVEEENVEEVVRCADCKYHFRKYGEGNYQVVHCTKLNRNRSPRWYCADGERKDDE